MGLDADVLRKMRKAKNISQKELAEKCGLTQQRIAYIESGKSDNLRLDTITKIVESMGYTGDDFAREFGEEYTKIFLQQAETETDETATSENLLVFFNQLNDTGKQEAVKRVEELTHIEKYTAE